MDVLERANFPTGRESPAPFLQWGRAGVGVPFLFLRRSHAVPNQQNNPRPLDGTAIALGDTVAFLFSVIPAEAGIQRPKTRHSPLDSRLRGNDGNREVGEPKCDFPALHGGPG